MTPKHFHQHLEERGKKGWRARKSLTGAERQQLRDHINRKFDKSASQEALTLADLWEVYCGR